MKFDDFTGELEMPKRAAQKLLKAITERTNEGKSLQMRKQAVGNMLKAVNVNRKHAEGR